VLDKASVRPYPSNCFLFFKTWWKDGGQCGYRLLESQNVKSRVEIREEDRVVVELHPESGEGTLDEPAALVNHYAHKQIYQNLKNCTIIFYILKILYFYNYSFACISLGFRHVDFPKGYFSLANLSLA